MKKEYYRDYYNPDYRIEYNGVEYSVMVGAHGEGWYTPAVPYLKNGDPGYPADGDWEIKEISIFQIKVLDDVTDDWVILQGSPEEIKKLEKILSNIIEEELEEDDFKDPEDLPEDPKYMPEEDW